MSTPVFVSADVRDGIAARLERLERAIETNAPAFQEKIRGEVAAARRAASALDAIAQRAGLSEITELLPGGARVVVLGQRDGKAVALKISGAPAARDGLLGEGPTYEAIAAVDPNAPMAKLVDYGVDQARGVDFVVTEVHERRRLHDRVVGGGSAHFSTTLEMIQALRQVPSPAVTQGDQRFKSFKDHRISGPINDTTQLLDQSERYATLVASTRAPFNQAVKELAHGAIYVGLGDAKAVNTLEGPTFFDPDGCLTPLGWDSAQMIAESNETQGENFEFLIEAAVASEANRLRLSHVDVSETAVRRSLLLSVGVLERIYAGYGIGNEQTAINEGRDPTKYVTPAIEDRLACAERSFALARALPDEMAVSQAAGLR